MAEIPSPFLWGTATSADQIEGASPIFITENGGAFPGRLAMKNVVRDDESTADFNLHLGAFLDAVEEAIDVRGYFIWSLLDNVEWAEGYSKRFGIVRVDYETQRRAPMACYQWLRQAIVENRLSSRAMAAE